MLIIFMRHNSFGFNSVLLGLSVLQGIAQFYLVHLV